ncbi:MAG: DUF1460 domain-containing protein [Bacteroidales bacterium]|nr:DUF1460 domain-containing protein [Bacteroidales bacterium]
MARKNIISLIFALIFLNQFQATAQQEINFHHESTDTARITEILVAESAQPQPGSLTRIAEHFIGKPYEGGTLDGDETEILRVNIDTFDCTTFVETVLALAYTAAEHRQSWHDFVYNLRHFRYRNGDTDGYASRLHYVSDWIIDNSARGLLHEVTAASPKVRYGVKSLDYMTTHRESYPALTDDENFRAMKHVEAGYSNHRFPYLKGSGLKGKHIAEIARDGDIIIFTTSIRGLDATHMGIIKLDNDGEPRLIHASSNAGKVVIDELPVADYIAKHRSDGIRIIRMKLD